MNLIILAAGDSFELDGFNKLKIKNPKSNKTIIEEYVDIFDVKKVLIVVGFKAMEIMNQYPEFTYIYNKKWQTTGSAFSLSLALSEEPCIVLSSDFLISINLKEALNKENNYTVIKNSESRRLTSLNAKLINKQVESVYRGKSNNNNPELIGIFREDRSEILRIWKKNCLLNPRAYAGETYPYEKAEIQYFKIEDKDITEINTPEDYINYIQG